MDTISLLLVCFFFQAEDGIRDHCVTGVQTCALPICSSARRHQWQTDLLPLRLGQISSATGAASPMNGRMRRSVLVLMPSSQIGRASCRERGGGQVVAVAWTGKERVADRSNVAHRVIV